MTGVMGSGGTGLGPPDPRAGYLPMNNDLYWP